MADGSYQVFARRFRPATFAEVVGQEAITRTLANAVAGGRVAQAYLFAGPRGVGKTSVARILAKSLNCAHGPTVTPCGTCDNCRAIAAGNDTDVLEIDGASHGLVEDVRKLCERIRYAPAHSRNKIYIIDEVHSISGQAFNALLKTLEEPQPNTLFIFATTRADKVPETIASRCQRFVFRRIGTADIAAKLARIAAAEGLTAEPEALTLIARQAAGSIRDAESLFDQVIAFSGERITRADVEQNLGLVPAEAVAKLAAAVLAGDGAAVLHAIADLSHEGQDLTQTTRQLTEYLRDLMVLAAAPERPDLVDVTGEELEKLRRAAAQHTAATLLNLIHIFLDAQTTMTRALTPRIVLEYAAMKAARVKRILPLEEVLATYRDADVSPARPAPGAAAEKETPARETPDPTPKSLTELWQLLQTALAKSAPPLHALITPARLISFENGVLRLGFPPSHRLAAQKVADDKRRAELAAAMGDILHQPV